MSNRIKYHYLHKGEPLGNLGRIAESVISENQVILSRLLKDSEKKYKAGDMYTFDDIDLKYNTEISDDEKRAWVWYKRTQNAPMLGWEKYFINDKIKPKDKEKIPLVTNKATTIKDNHFRDIATVPSGVFVGYATKYKLPYAKDTYLIFTTHEGNKQYINEKDVTFDKATSEAENIPDSVKELVSKGALFYSKSKYYPLPHFSFGNMYDKEIQLKNDESYIVANFGKEVFDKHMEVVKAAKPPLLSVQSASPNDRPIILVFSNIAITQSMFYVTELREETGIILKTLVEDSDWKAFPWAGKKQKEELRSQWIGYDETQALEYRLPLRDAFKFWLASLPNSDFTTMSRQNIEKYYVDKDGFSKLLSEDERDEISREAPKVGEELFAKFLHEALTFEDQQKLDYTFNRLYNAFADINVKKVPIGFNCSAFFKSKRLEFSAAQREGIAFMEVVDSGTIAYDVGVGKTMTAILTLANAMQQGKYKRPLLVVPNQTYRKWIKELIGYKDKDGQLYGVLSGTNIIINELYNLGVGTVKDKDGVLYAGNLNLTKKLPENSITIVTYEGFKRLGLADTKEDFEEMNRILEQRGRTFKNPKEAMAFILSTQEAFSKVNKDSIVDLQSLGIDQITIDEAHAAKNVFETVRADKEGNKRYQIGSGSSDFGIKAFFFCNSVIRKTGGNVMLLTATPFTNSPLEIFSMLSLVGYATIKRMGYNNLSDFMSMFVRESYEYVNKLDGSIDLGHVVKAYTNRQILQKLINHHILYKTGEDAGVLRPKKVNLPLLKKVDAQGRIIEVPKEEQILTYLKMTDLQKFTQESLEMQLNIAMETMGQKNSPYNLGDIGRMLNQNLDNALSPYLLKEDEPDIDDLDFIKTPPLTHISFVEESPKINYIIKCVANVKKHHEANNQEVSGQVIYCNRGVRFFPLMVKYLNEVVGYKKVVEFNGKKFNEVEQIHSGVSKDRIEMIKDAFLANTVKVIIGTSSIREGIDLQTFSSCLYIATPTWNPTDITQVEGRIWRQGNRFKGVRVVMPLMQDSMDIFVFQKLQEKTARINDIWFKATRGNVLNQESLDPEEIKLALFSKIEPLVKIRLEFLNKENARKLSIAQTSLEALEVFKNRYQSYVWNRAVLVTNLSRLESKLASMLKEIKKPTLRFDAETIKKEKQLYIKRLIPLYERIILSNSDIDDKVLLRIYRDFMTVISLSLERRNYFELTYESAGYSANYRIEGFTEALSAVKKTERDLLNPRGYTADNVPNLIDEIKQEIVMLEYSSKFLRTPQAAQNAEKYVQEMKEKYVVDSANIQKRVDDFAMLNFMLNEYEPTLQTPQQPEPETQPTPDDAELTRKRRIRIARAKAIALLLLLKINKN